METRRVVITGMGALTPVGNNVPAFWEGLLAGKNGIGPVTRFDTAEYKAKLAAEVKDFVPENYLPKPEIKRMGRFTQFAVVSAMAAMADANFTLDEAEADRGAEQVRRIRELVANKGDGRFHVFMLNIITPGLKGKPGDSTLMIFPKGKTMLLDAAVTASGHWVVELLEKTGIDRLDYMAASHPHIDHVGGMAEVIDSLHKRGGSIGEFWYPGRDCKGYLAEIRTHLAEGTPFRSFVTGDVETIDGVTIRFYNPSPEDLVGVDDTAMLDVETGNNVSLAMHFTFGRATFLASGDLYAGKEATVAQRFGSALHADIMKANHHGAYTSNTEVWLDTVAPKIVYAISDDDGCYELVERTEKRGIAYYTMGMDGSTLISVDENRNFEILTQKNSTLHHTYKGIIGRM